MTEATEATPKRRRWRATGKIIAGIRARMALSVPEFAAALGTHQSSVYRWEATTTPRLRPQPATAIAVLSAVSDDVLKVIGDDVRKAAASGVPAMAAQVMLTAVNTLIEQARAQQAG